jgi:hypothetical protein
VGGPGTARQQNGLYWQKFTKGRIYPRIGTVFGINYPGFAVRAQPAVDSAPGRIAFV